MQTPGMLWLRSARTSELRTFRVLYKHRFNQKQHKPRGAAGNGRRENDLVYGTRAQGSAPRTLITKVPNREVGAGFTRICSMYASTALALKRLQPKPCALSPRCLPGIALPTKQASDAGAGINKSRGCANVVTGLDIDDLPRVAQKHWGMLRHTLRLATGILLVKTSPCSPLST